MKKFLGIFLGVVAAIVVAIGADYFVQLTAVKRAHLTTHYISFSSKKHCSATAIGRHAILTAEHCAPTKNLTFSDWLLGKDPTPPDQDIWVDSHPAHIDQAIYDGHDHVIYLLSNVSFSYLAEFGTGFLGQGDSFFLFGNPSRLQDAYRQGYVIGIDNSLGAGTSTILDMNGFFGDSGSAVFSKRGNILAVMVAEEVFSHDDVQMKIMYASDLAFRPSDYERARKY